MATDGLTFGVPTRQLADGNQIPLLGFGVWQVPEGDECIKSVRWALEAGYRHIDTAQAYGNEESVGRALSESGLSREEVFVTTKFYPGHRHPLEEAEASLRRLGTDYVDLYIIHWPQGGPTWAWAEMERAQEAGYARSIGVSNFGLEDLQELRAIASAQPVINQVQFSPFEFRKGLLDACTEMEIALESYSTLGTGRHLDQPAVTAIAEAHGRTPAQVLLRWCVQREIPVLPKSTHQDRIEQNAQIFDFELSETDMTALDGLDESGATSAARHDKWWK